MEFLYAKNIESDEPIMLLNKHIGNDDEDGIGIDGSLFQEELLALDAMGKKRIQVWINSVGGIVMDGYNICNAILKSKTRVDTYCLGMAASIAGVIFQTGRKRVMADYGILMYHNPYGGETDSPLLDNMKDSLNKIISERSGMDVDAVHRMMDRTSFIQADEAMKMGLCDEIESTIKLNKKNTPKDAKAHWREANKVINKIFDTPKNKKMLKVTNKLHLNDDANEESIVRAIDEVVNKAVTAATEVLNKKSKDDLDKMKSDMDDLEDKLKKMQADYDKAKNDLEEAEDKIKNAEEEAKAKEAKDMVMNYVKMGKIKNESKVIADWSAKAKADMKGTKDLLESIPTNKAAIKFEIINGEKKEPVDSVALAMARISNKMDKK